MFAAETYGSIDDVNNSSEFSTEYFGGTVFEEGRKVGVTEEALKVITRPELCTFLANLAEGTKSGQVESEHESVSALIEAASDWLEDFPRYFAGLGIEMPPEKAWQFIAVLFSAAHRI